MLLIIKHVPIEGPGSIGEFFAEKGYSLKTIELSEGDKLPPEPDGVEGVIALGGPMNVYETGKYPFLKEEDIFIREVLKREIPFLGICLGAQLLAKAAGGCVAKAEQEEIGFFKVSLTSEGRADMLFNGIEGCMDVMQWHGDTFSIPERSTLLATSGSVENQALRVGRNAYGLQFHLEINEDMIKDWSGEYLKSSDEEMMEKGRHMLARYAGLKDSLVRNAGRICANFEALLTV